MNRSDGVIALFAHAITTLRLLLPRADEAVR
jgi:hypothetical protein